MKYINKSTIGLIVVWLVSTLSLSDQRNILWMTDGSSVEFSDTLILSSVMTPEDLLGSHEYEGSLDFNPYIGDTVFPVWRDSYLSLESEWVLIRENGFTELVDEDTEIVLQGMIDAKYFSEFQNSSSHWIPASIGNNVVAAGSGIKTTIGALLRGEVSALSSIEFKDRWGRKKTYYSKSESIADLPLIELLNEVIRNQSEVITHINLGAIEEHSAWVSDLKNQVPAAAKYLFKCGLTNSCDDKTLMEGALEVMSHMIVWKREYMNKSGQLIVTDGDGNTVGAARVSVQ